MTSKNIPNIAWRTTLAKEIEKFLHDYSDLHLGGEGDFHAERRHHLEVFGIHSLPEDKIHPIGEVEFTALRGPHGTIPIRVLYPKSAPRNGKDNAALIHFHGGGYTVGSVDEFENGLRLLAEEACVQIYAADYRLAPEFRHPVQLDEYSAIIDALQGDFGAQRGVSKDKLFGGGDTAGGNMAAAIALRRHDEGKPNLAGQMLFYP
jgi:acetyl esterase/lipase